MTNPTFLSRRSFFAGSVVSVEAARSRIALAASPLAPPQEETGPSSWSAEHVSYRDRAPGAVLQPLGRLLDHDSFINAFRFFTAAEIADVTGYHGQADVTAALQRALDGSWATDRDLFLPSGLYRVKSLTLPGGEAQRSRAFRVYGQGSGELFARAESGGTIVKGDPGASVLRARMASFKSGNGNQEIAYIRFEGRSSTPVLDLETLYAQSELHHCGIFQSGSGDGVRIGHANTIEVHHNYVLNSDWNETHKQGRTGSGIRLSARGDNGLMTLRKNTTRGFSWGIWLGGTEAVLYSPRIEQCESSVCTNGIRLDNVRGGVVENCYFEGGDGGIAIQNVGDGNTIANNLVFAGFAIGIDDDDRSKATRIVNNTLSAGNARTVHRLGCTLIRINGNGATKLVLGNYLISDPVSFGAVNKVVGLAIAGDARRVDVIGNAFEPVGAWGAGEGTAQLTQAASGM